MTNKEINKKLEEGILDLWSKDICVPKKEMNEIIQEYEDGK